MYLLQGDVVTAAVLVEAVDVALLTVELGTTLHAHHLITGRAQLRVRVRVRVRMRVRVKVRLRLGLGLGLGPRPSFRLKLRV